MYQAQFIDHVQQSRLQAIAALVQHDALPQAASGEVHDVVDKRRHAVGALRDGVRNEAPAIVQRHPPQKIGTARDGCDPIPQVVPQHCDELVAQVVYPLRASERPASALASRDPASRWKAIRSANILNIPSTVGLFSFAGFGSIAHKVP